MHQITLFRDKKFKNFIERAAPPPQTHSGKGNISTSGASILAPTALDTPPPQGPRSTTA